MHSTDYARGPKGSLYYRGRVHQRGKVMTKPIYVSGSSPTLAGVIWQERYDCYSARVAGWLDLAFSYRDGAYHVSVFGQRLKAAGTDSEHAAKIAVEAARVMLERAQKELA